MRFYLTIVLLFLVSGCGTILWLVSTSMPAGATDMTFGFKNPSFSGAGYSSHVLSVEQLQFTRDKDRKAKKESDLAQAVRDAKNQTINKFLVNVESRIYAQLSKQLVDSMFGENCSSDSSCPTSGTATIEGNTIFWEQVGQNINITITEADGTVTTISVPTGDFEF